MTSSGKSGPGAVVQRINKLLAVPIGTGVPIQVLDAPLLIQLNANEPGRQQKMIQSCGGPNGVLDLSIVAAWGGVNQQVGDLCHHPMHPDLYLSVFQASK